MQKDFLWGSFRKLVVTPLALAACALVVLMGLIGYLYFSVADSGRATEVIRLATDISTSLYRAESAERGYLLTGVDAFLVPYTDNVPLIRKKMQRLSALLADNVDEAQAIERANSVFNQWRSRVDALIQAHINGVDIVPIVRQGRGRDLVAQVTSSLDEVASAHRQKRTDSFTRMGTTLAVLCGALLLSFVALAGLFCVIGYKELSRVARIKAEGEAAHAQRNALLLQQTRLAEAESRVARMFVDQPSVADIGPSLLALLCQWSGALVGALYVSADGGQRFERVATYGTVRQSHAADVFQSGEGLPGEAARSMQTQWLHSVPVDYMPLASQLGDMAPGAIMALPVQGSYATNAVIELGFQRDVDADSVQLLERLRGAIGHAVEVTLLR